MHHASVCLYNCFNRKVYQLLFGCYEKASVIYYYYFGSFTHSKNNFLRWKMMHSWSRKKQAGNIIVFSTFCSLNGRTLTQFPFAVMCFHPSIKMMLTAFLCDFIYFWHPEFHLFIFKIFTWRSDFVGIILFVSRSVVTFIVDKLVLFIAILSRVAGDVIHNAKGMKHDFKSLEEDKKITQTQKTIWYEDNRFCCGDNNNNDRNGGSDSSLAEWPKRKPTKLQINKELNIFLLR